MATVSVKAYDRSAKSETDFKRSSSNKFEIIRIPLTPTFVTHKLGLAARGANTDTKMMNRPLLAATFFSSLLGCLDATGLVPHSSASAAVGEASVGVIKHAGFPDRYELRADVGWWGEGYSSSRPRIKAPDGTYFGTSLTTIERLTADELVQRFAGTWIVEDRRSLPSGVRTELHSFQITVDQLSPFPKPEIFSPAEDARVPSIFDVRSNSFRWIFSGASPMAPISDLSNFRMRVDFAPGERERQVTLRLALHNELRIPQIDSLTSSPENTFSLRFVRKSNEWVTRTVTAVIPEPTSGLLAMLTICGVLMTRRR